MLDTLLDARGRTDRLRFWTAVPGLGIAYLVSNLALLIVSQGVFVWKPVWIEAALIALTAGFVGAGTVLGIRRLHDRNESGWWILLAFIPVLGQLWYLVWNGSRPSSAGFGRYDAEAAAVIGAVFDAGDTPTAPRRTPPRAAVALAALLWVGLLITVVVTILLFQNPS